MKKLTVTEAYDRLARAEGRLSVLEEQIAKARMDVAVARKELLSATESKGCPYIYIQAWGKLLGSFNYFIRSEVAKAQRQGAPETAIFESGDGWHTFEGIESADTKRRVEVIAARLRGVAPENRPAGC